MEKNEKITITEEMSGKRLDAVLADAFEGYSRNFIQKLIGRGCITIDGKPCSRKKYKASGGETVVISVPEPETVSIGPEDIELDIVYEDECMLVVDKPAGMLVHPAPGVSEGTLVNALMYHCRDGLSSISGVVRPGIVHRIDKDTSGLLMVAKNDTAHNALSQQLMDHSITRRYKAIVYNNIKGAGGTVDMPIGRDRKNRMKKAVTDRNARNAVTHYRVLERFGKFTLIEAELETGRTHQIRVHMSYIKHPLLGDTLYGPAENSLGVRRQMLHAGVLGFRHPVTGRYMEFESPLPDDFQKALERLRK